jgi:hypothetical protein
MLNPANAQLQTAARCDVLVIGGGPAGATIAALLAERGRDVVLIEKARHPRFHIGESLLPLNMPLFERLGVDNARDASDALQAFDRTMRHGPKLFSWFIYRVTTPTLRDLFMSPGDSRLQEAVLSVLAGDIFRGTPLGLRLFAFKTVYYLINFFNPRRTLSAWKKRKRILGEPNAETTAI